MNVRSAISFNMSTLTTSEAYACSGETVVLLKAAVTPVELFPQAIVKVDHLHGICSTVDKEELLPSCYCVRVTTLRLQLELKEHFFR